MSEETKVRVKPAPGPASPQYGVGDVAVVVTHPDDEAPSQTRASCTALPGGRQSLRETA